MTYFNGVALETSVSVLSGKVRIARTLKKSEIKDQRGKLENILNKTVNKKKQQN